ncbi:sigma-54-dependent transcriptional regulator [Avrilella dinanensis]|uniref:Sigma-54-dependent Fis family transcriptional regulator n=1 Tax=Avrilella dinanensis TaxID=2008672 RepID=A0A2M9R6W6_9FLAO|nr:sigma-54 dependent transcriptional regulator [Avrilella dinanensis]PJR04600.1 sigma-54-dependent Fis family transcriptional regulator [Avrilella dinanensis]
MATNNILVIDDDVSFCMLLNTFLTRKGFAVSTAYSIEEAKQLFDQTKFQLILTDVRLPDGDGVEILKYVKEENPMIQVILMTGYTDIKTAVNAMKLGAFDYVAKPINSDQILDTIQQALSKSTDKRTVSEPRTAARENSSEQVSNVDYVKGKSEKSKQLHHFIDVVAPTNISVLIIGESGTGKENIAYSIHKKSERAQAPYIAVDCGAIPKDLAASEFFGHVKGSFTGAANDKTGHFEAANGGTVFLDEVGNLSYDVQIQLLRALQERKVKPVGSSKEIDVDIRVIAATNEDLQKAVRDGKFREDLYHRLNEFSIQAPRLAERKEDILSFADFFLHQSNSDLNKNVRGFSPEVQSFFLEYEWPGNLREMRNIIKRAVLLCVDNVVGIDVLPSEIFDRTNDFDDEDIEYESNSQEDNLKLYSSKSEEKTIRLALEKAKFNKTKAAKILGIDRKTLYNKIKLYDIEV